MCIRDRIRTLRERMIQISGEKDASIFDAHILLLQDKIILQQVQTELLKRLQNCLLYTSIPDRVRVCPSCPPPIPRDGIHGENSAFSPHAPAGSTIPGPEADVYKRQCLRLSRKQHA